MKKKNGFTLVELIAVIVILSIVLTLSVPSLIGALKNNKEQALEKINELIILAAKDYVVDYGLEIPRKITQNELCKNYLDCPIINPVTKEEMVFSVIVDANKNYTIDKNELVELKVVLNGGKLSKDISGGYASNSEVLLENPKRDNYGFAGWEVISGDAVIEGSILKLGTKNSTIIANWTGTPVKLSVDLDGGVSDVTFKREYYTRDMLDLGTPTKDNYLFLGWKLVSGEAVLSGNKLTFGLEDVSIKAVWVSKTFEFAYTGAEQAFIVVLSGKYKIELWGASGGYNTQYAEGAGAYTSGIINLSENDVLYIYVGSIGSTGCTPYTSCTGTAFNGGGAGGYFTVSSYLRRIAGGGGATDVRLVSGTWSDLTSLRSRIMVAGAGGGAYNIISTGGSAGGLTGYSGSHGSTSNVIIGTGGTQISGGSGKNAGSFGIGANSYILRSNVPNNNDAGGAGGGYYGGGGGQSGDATNTDNGGVSNGGGGSSYISGHTGCVAVTSSSDTTPKSGCTTGTTDNFCSIHYSGKVFTNTVMIDGQGYNWTNTKGEQVQMPNPTGGNYAAGKGHYGNGYARITYLDE